MTKFLLLLLLLPLLSHSQNDSGSNLYRIANVYENALQHYLIEYNRFNNNDAELIFFKKLYLTPVFAHKLNNPAIKLVDEKTFAKTLDTCSSTFIRAYEIFPLKTNKGESYVSIVEYLFVNDNAGFYLQGYRQSDILYSIDKINKQLKFSRLIALNLKRGR